MSMVDMKLSPKERKEAEEPSIESPKYPWGLQLSLDEEQISKLKLDKALGVGESVSLRAVATVSSVSSHESVESSKGASEHVSIQITALEVQVEKSDAEKASKLYNSEKEA